MKKIRIVTCYYGTFPSWMSLWVASCEANPNIDFLVISDQNYKVDEASNVKFQKIEWNKLKEKIQKCFAKEICLSAPYKLCDYRPFFGMIFSEELKGYDFWGHCDLDMLFGNVEELLTDDILNKYDRIGEYGAFTVYRNCEKINNLYKQRGAAFSWNKVISTDSNCIFDEMAGMNSICKKQQIKWFKNISIIDCATRLKRIGLSTTNAPEIFTWSTKEVCHYYIKKGKVIRLPAVYMHFSGKVPRFIESDYDVDGHYLITSAKIIKMNQKVTMDFIKNNTEYVSKKDDEMQIKKTTHQKIKKFMLYTIKEKIIRFKIMLYIRLYKLEK